MIRRVEYGDRQYLNIPDDGDGFDIPKDVLETAILAQKWEYAREKRDALLRASDYAVVPDSPLTDAQLTEVKAYRQALRDVPENATDPDAIDWPTKPEFLTQ